MSEAPKRLRLVAEPARTDAGELELADAIRATRRSAARFLRALQASGHAIASWPEALITRLAHADAVTARFLVEPQRVDPDQVRDAATALRSIEATITDRLTGSERARLRSFELAIRIDTEELARPLLQLPRVDDDEETSSSRSTSRGSLRAGLGALDEHELDGIGRRLGLSRRFEPTAGARHEPTGRRALEQDIARVLRDDALLGILLETLPTDALELLAALVRGSCSEATLLALGSPSAIAVGESRGASPGDALVRCGLAFVRHDAIGLAVPVELRPRLDGVLRSFGV